jgi:hypothetical protein
MKSIELVGAEAQTEVEGDHRLEHGEGHEDVEEQVEEQPHALLVHRQDQADGCRDERAREIVPAGGGEGGGPRLRQGAQGDEEVRSRQDCNRVEGSLDAVERGERAAEHGPHDHARPEGRADDAHAPGALRRGGDVGDHRLGGTDARGEEAGEPAGQVDPADGVRVVPSSEISRTGRRPTRSEIQPQTGRNSSWASA